MVLPDTDRAAHVVPLLRKRHDDLREVAHASGRPWLAGQWDADELVLGRTADRRLAVLGEHSATAEGLDAFVARCGKVSDLDAFAARLRGSAHVIASLGGEVRVQGTVTGLRRVYQAKVEGVAVAGDHATELARLAGARVDRARIATRLLFSAPPWPLHWNSAWEDVRSVPPGHYLAMDRDAAVRVVRYWSPPAQELSLADAAEALRVALTEAVAVRVKPGQRTVSHLSGLDSSSLCCLAVLEKADVVALTSAQPDAMDEDVMWATRTVSALRESGYELTHDVIAAEESPLVYADVLGARHSFDEPFPFLHNWKRVQFIVERGRSYGPAVHLMGIGGDEMVWPGNPWLHTLLRRAPLTGLAKLRVAADKHRWSRVELIRTLVRHRTYADWLGAAARGVEHGVARPHREPNVGWGARPTVPAWISREAVELVRQEFAAAAAGDAALADDRGTHSMLSVVHNGSQTMRSFQRIGAAEGERLAAPFFDDHVLEAALSLRVTDRVDPHRYKPLLVQAMRDVVPATTLRRTTKSETAATAVLGSRAHRDQITAIAENSQLAELGLVDLAELRRACRSPIDVVTPNRRIEPTIGCEMWLRNRKEDSHVHVGR